MFASFYRCCQRIPAHIAALQHQIEQLMGSGRNAFIAGTDISHRATVGIDIIRSLPTAATLRSKNIFPFLPFCELMENTGMGSRYALITLLINSASDWASASPSTWPSLSTPKYGESPVVFAKALTDLSQEFFFFLSSSLLKSYVDHSATNLVSMVSISNIKVQRYQIICIQAKSSIERKQLYLQKQRRFLPADWFYSSSSPSGFIMPR